MKKINLKKIIQTLLVLTTLHVSSYAKDTETLNMYYYINELLDGEWSFSAEDKQVGTTGAHKCKSISHLVGTDDTAMAYKVIAGGTTLQEDLFPGTKKQMVTMYHCNSIHNCTELKATHYCAKRNQPQFLLNTKESTDEKIVFDCDMSTELCNSDEDHVHKIIHELSEDGEHLKSSYLGWKNQKLNKKNSIYHFDRK